MGSKMKRLRHRRIPWSDLPSELLLDIAGRLEGRADFLHFRAVCKQWRSSAPFSLLPSQNLLSPLFPHNISTSILPSSRETPQQIIVQSSIFLLRSRLEPETPPWILSVEELNPGKLYLREPLSRVVIRDLPENFPRFLCLPDFHVTQIGTSYNIRFGNDIEKWESQTICSVEHEQNKVVLALDPECKRTCPSTDDYMEMVLFDKGTLMGLRLRDGFTRPVRRSNWYFDDVVNFEGRVIAIDRKGRAHLVDCDTLRTDFIVDEPMTNGSPAEPKKRLVESCGELYMVRKYSDFYSVFEVYRLNEEEGTWDYVEGGFGGERILLMTFDGCFFVSSKDLPHWKGNCVVLNKFCCPSFQLGWKSSKDLYQRWGWEAQAKVFHFDSGTPSGDSSNYLWPPPAWLSPDTYRSNRGSDEDEEEQSDMILEQSLDSSLIRETPLSSGSEAEEQEKADSPGVHIQGNLPDPMQGITPTIPDEVTSSESTSSAAASESVKHVISKVKFQGVDVGSDLLPTLEKIWAKHGNVLEGHALRSSDLLSWALESLAKMVIILQSSTARSLTKSQADYLSSTLPDLKLMRLKIDWLTPFVEKALASHKAMASQEEMERSLDEICKLLAQVEEVREKLLAELGGLEERLDKQQETVIKGLSVLAQADQDVCLGEGLC